MSVCIGCNKKLNRKSKFGRFAKWCSKACFAANNKVPSRKRVCHFCKSEFEPKRLTKYCSSECREENCRQAMKSHVASCIFCHAARSLHSIKLGTSCRCNNGSRGSEVVSCDCCKKEITRSNSKRIKSKGISYCSKICHDEGQRFNGLLARRFSQQIKLQKANSKETAFPMPCKRCGAITINGKFCSDNCKELRKCKICKCWFNAPYVSICSDSCRKESSRKSRKQTHAKIKLKAKTCHETKNKLREAKKNSEHIRRVRMKGARHDKINFTDIYNRDNWRCVYCSVIVRKYKDNPGIQPDEATIDHVVPLAVSGTHTYDNIVTCCRSCNSKKGASVWQVKQKKVPQKQASQVY